MPPFNGIGANEYIVDVTGYPVAKQNLVADGALRDLTFEAAIERSSWLAVRILPSSHTNPVWVLVTGKPVRASRRSADRKAL